MSNKIILPKDVCKTLDILLSKSPYKDRPDYLIRDLYKSDGLLVDHPALYNIPSILDLMQALVLGYEPDLTPEERIKGLWNQQEKVCDFANGIREGIRQTLLIHGIKYDWLK